MSADGESMARAASTRAEYLLGSRRVRISDLLDAHLLCVGEMLVFTRPRLGEEHSATVTAKGHLALNDGRVFTSPSRAASGAVGGGSFDGWQAWTVAQSGELLDVVRQRLLSRPDDPFEGTSDDASLFGEDEESAFLQEPDLKADVRGRQEWLRMARGQAEREEYITLPVRKLLALWAGETRTLVVSEHVDTDLANHGLVTVPDFRKVTIDTTVEIRLVVHELAVEGPSFKAPLVDGLGANEGGTEARSSDVGLTVGNLASSSAGLESVSPQATLDEAMTLMLLNDYSQVGVLSGKRSVVGAVSWKSIAQARHQNPGAPLSAAITRATVVPFDQELIDTLPLLEAEDFVFVSDSTKAISGIVTAADVVKAYGELATPFFLIGEMDRLLRQVVSQNFHLSDVVASCDPARAARIVDFNGLSMGDYQAVLSNPDRWSDLGWPLDRRLFNTRLNEMRAVRNDVMHFNPDPVPQGTVAKLRGIINVLRRFSAD